MSSGFPDQSAPNPFSAPPSAAPVPRRSGLMWGIGIGCLASICLCGGPCALLTGFGVYQAVSQKGDVELVIDETLRAIADGDTDGALAHSSKRAIDNDLITAEKLEQLTERPEFKEFETAKVTSINISASYNSDAKKPQGTVANVSGTVAYTDGGKGTFQATLEKEDGEWKLYSLRVNRRLSPSLEKSNAEKSNAEKPNSEKSSSEKLDASEN